MKLNKILIKKINTKKLKEEILHKKDKPKITKKSIQKELLNLDMQRFLHKHQVKQI